MDAQSQEFIARSLKALQEQINEQAEKIVELKARIYSLEEESRWNIIQGNTEQSPRDDIVVRLADGRLCFHNHNEEIDDGATD